MKTLILGLGNTILTDDGVGIYVVRRVRELLLHPVIAGPPKADEAISLPRSSPLCGPRDDNITIKETSLGGFNFIDLLTGYDRAMIIDAIHTKGGEPGEFYELDIRALRPSARISSLHGIDLATACEMAKSMKVPFPGDIKIFVMEVENEFTFGETCTPKVAANIDKMASSIIKHLVPDHNQL